MVRQFTPSVRPAYAQVVEAIRVPETAAPGKLRKVEAMLFAGANAVSAEVGNHWVLVACMLWLCPS